MTGKRLRKLRKRFQWRLQRGDICCDVTKDKDNDKSEDEIVNVRVEIQNRPLGGSSDDVNDYVIGEEECSEVRSNLDKVSCNDPCGTTEVSYSTGVNNIYQKKINGLYIYVLTIDTGSSMKKSYAGSKRYGTRDILDLFSNVQMMS